MVLDLFKLAGKTAWITGGSKGLGEVMAGLAWEVLHPKLIFNGRAI